MRAFARLVGAALLIAGPVIAQPLELQRLGVLDGPVDHVRTHGRMVYISAGNTFSVVDVSNPEAPVRRGTYTFPEQVWGFRLDGERAYVGANFFGLGVVDVSDADALRLASRLETLGQAKIGAPFGSVVAVIDHMDGVAIGDLSDEGAPSVVASFFVDGYGRDLVADGRLVYAVDSPAGLYVLDLGADDPAEPVGMLQEPGMPRSIEVTTLPDGRKLVCGPAGGHLQIYEVTSPNAPRHVATFPTPGRAQRVAVEGALVFVADGVEGVLIVDVGSPESPRKVGTHPTSAPVRDLAVGPSLLFVVEGQSEYEGEDRNLTILRRDK
ncbi:MAG: hypothetical protein VYE73_17130 [Acidobacteriota bacterium]|nr:hypothetical protein [Acidobacteriota bacterium]